MWTVSYEKNNFFRNEEDGNSSTCCGRLEDWRKVESSYGEMKYIPGDWKIEERMNLLILK